MAVSKRRDPLSEFATRGVADQAAVDKLSALYSPKKTTYASVEFVDVAAIGQEALTDRKMAREKGATYPMREMAELARGSGRAWERWAAEPGRRPEMAYGARTLLQLWMAMAFVMDAMADHERQEDEPPPAAFCRAAK